MRSKIIVSLALVLVGCAGAAATTGDGTSSVESASETPNASTESAESTEPRSSGRIELRLVDAPNAEIAKVLVTVDHVDVSMEGAGWTTLTGAPRTVDLLELQGGAFASLADGPLPSGHVNQLRLFLSSTSPSHVVTQDGVDEELQVPSGTESGIKIVGGFDVSPCATGSVTIDFDAARSVSYRQGGGNPHDSDGGTGGGWYLKPVIHLKAVTLASDGACADATAEEAGAPCEAVTCAEGEFCHNGSCVPAT